MLCKKTNCGIIKINLLSLEWAFFITFVFFFCIIIAWKSSILFISERKCVEMWVYKFFSKVVNNFKREIIFGLGLLALTLKLLALEMKLKNLTKIKRIYLKITQSSYKKFCLTEFAKKLQAFSIYADMKFYCKSAPESHSVVKLSIFLSPGYSHSFSFTWPLNDVQHKRIY